MYAKEYEQKHPKVLQARSCHGNVGDHRSAVGLANIHVEISCDHTKDIKLNYPPMVWNTDDNIFGSQDDEQNHMPGHVIGSSFEILLTGYVVQGTNVK